VRETRTFANFGTADTAVAHFLNGLLASEFFLHNRGLAPSG